MTLKSTWTTGDTFTAADANALATQVNNNAAALAAQADEIAGAYVKPSGGIPTTDLTSPVQTSLGKADSAVQPATLTSALAARVGLVQAAKNPDLLVTGSITLDGNDLLTSAAVVWPDGTPGTLTITFRDLNNAVLAYNITYGSPVTKTFTQPTITRNANGAATNVPAIVVS
jgi:hypothetical protein